MYSPSDSDFETVLVDDNNINAVNYTVLKDPLIDTSQREDVRKMVKEAEERTKETSNELDHLVVSRKPKFDIDIEILNKPGNKSCRDMIKKHYFTEATEKPSNQDVVIRDRNTDDLIEDVIYAVCVKRDPLDLKIGSSVTVETQENVTDVRDMIRDVEERVRSAEASSEKFHRGPLLSRTSSNASIQSGASLYCKSLRSVDSHTCNSMASSVDVCWRCKCRLIETNSSNSVLDSFVNCHVEDYPPLSHGDPPLVAKVRDLR